MAVTLRTLVALRNPNPDLHGAARPGSLSCAPPLRFAHSAQFPREKCRLGVLLSPNHRRVSRLVPFAASPQEESKLSDFEVEREKRELETEHNESEEAWKKTMETFKEEAMKLKDVSLEAYDVYSKKAMVILKQSSEELKIQAEKASHEVGKIAQEIGEEGKEYLSSAPDSVKEVVEPFSYVDDWKDVAALQDFHVGIPYGSFLVIGGFLSFMLTGSISAVRFGVILGAAIFALSIQSLRAWKRGQPSPLLLKSQAAIVAIIFIREWQLFFQQHSFPHFVMTFISGAALAFYIYRIMTNLRGEGEKFGEHLENK